MVIITHNEYQIAETKSDATRDQVKACRGCKVLDYVELPRL